MDDYMPRKDVTLPPRMPEAAEITDLRARLEAVEKERDEAQFGHRHEKSLRLEMIAHVERAEAALATARRDAWGRAAMATEAWIARKENLISLPDTIRALANEAET